MSHHFEDALTKVEESTLKGPGDSWQVTFRRSDGNAQISMRIPKKGIFDNPNLTAALKKTFVEKKLAPMIADILRKSLMDPEAVKKRKK